MRGPGAGNRRPTRNRDVDWDAWPVQEYLAENYRELHPSDAAVIRHHSDFHRQFSLGAIERSLEFGAGPNLYPLMLAAVASRRIEAVEIGAGNVAYLTRPLCEGPDESWQTFYALCRRPRTWRSSPSSATPSPSPCARAATSSHPSWRTCRATAWGRRRIGPDARCTGLWYRRSSLPTPSGSRSPASTRTAPCPTTATRAWC